MTNRARKRHAVERNLADLWLHTSIFGSPVITHRPDGSAVEARNERWVMARRGWNEARIRRECGGMFGIHPSDVIVRWHD